MKFYYQANDCRATKVSTEMNFDPSQHATSEAAAHAFVAALAVTPTDEYPRGCGEGNVYVRRVENTADTWVVGMEGPCGDWGFMNRIVGNGWEAQYGEETYSWELEFVGSKDLAKRAKLAAKVRAMLAAS